MGRLRRKDEHIVIRLKQKAGLADFSHIHFVHNCLPERDLDEVTLETTLLGRKLGSPLFINALTGGTPLSKKIRRSCRRGQGVRPAHGPGFADGGPG